MRASSCLERAALRAGLGEARGEYDDAADAARARSALTASRMPACGIASTAQSTPIGRSAGDLRHGRPLISVRFGVDQMDVARETEAVEIGQTPAPSEPGVGEAPTIAIERGRSMRSIGGRAACVPSAVASLIALIGAEAGPEALLVEELLQALVAAAFGIEEARLMALGHQILVRHLP